MTHINYKHPSFGLKVAVVVLLVVSCGRRHSWNVEAGTVMFLNLKKILLNESNYMVMFFNKPHYTFSIYMYVILDIGVRYASNVHLLVLDMQDIGLGTVWMVGVNIYLKENDLPLPFAPTNICLLECLDEVVNVDVYERGRAGPTTNLLQFATF
jgi:hypothetical protein